MKKISIGIALSLLSLNVWAIGPTDDNIDTEKQKSLEVMELSLGKIENGILNKNSTILFVFKKGEVEYMLAIQRVDGKEIPKIDGVLQLPTGVELATVAVINNTGTELASFPIGFAFGDKNFRDKMGIKKAQMETPDGTIKEYKLSKLFTNNGSFISEIIINNLKVGKTTISMYSKK